MYIIVTDQKLHTCSEILDKLLFKTYKLLCFRYYPSE